MRRRGRKWPRQHVRGLILAGAIAGCGSPEHQPPIDLSLLPGPDASQFSRERELLGRLEAELPGLYSQGEDGFLRGTAGVRLHYHVNRAPNERAVVVLLPGRTEPVAKYVEVIADLVFQGYSVYALDHRGQGESGRMLPNRQAGYVEFFQDYVDDVETFLDRVVRVDSHPRLFLLAHSMGGAIGLLHASQHPGAFDALALSAPMLDIDTGSFPTPLAFGLGATVCGVSEGSAYAPGSGAYTEESSVSESDVTHSEPRWTMQRDLLRQYADLRVGGPTYRWVCEALAASSYAQTTAQDNPQLTLVFRAAEDAVVRPDGLEAYCSVAPRCQVSTIPGAFHEILMETDSRRNEALSQALRFFRYSEEH